MSHASHASHTKKCNHANMPKNYLKGDLGCVLVCLKAILKKQEKLKSKLGLPRVTIRDQIIPQPKSPR